MLCSNCKKNQATKSYEAIKKGKKVLEYYCLDCYDRLFHSTENLAIGQGQVCVYCGTTAEEFKKRNLVGCAKCYQTLQEITASAVTKMQGSQTHKGKKPVGDASERIARRCGELKMIVDKLNAEKNFSEARAYTERLVKLQEGTCEEDFVWRKHLLSSKQS